MTDFRELCARMADELDHYRQLLMDDRRETHALATEARAALAQPDLQGPSDNELLALMPETMRDEFSYAAKVCSDATFGQVKPGIFRVALNTAALKYAQAVLNRYGNNHSCIVELRARIETLEAALHKHIRQASSSTVTSKVLDVSDLPQWTPEQAQKLKDLLGCYRNHLGLNE